MLNAPLGTVLSLGALVHRWNCSALFDSELEVWHVFWVLDEKVLCCTLNRLHSRDWLREWTVRETNKSLL